MSFQVQAVKPRDSNIYLARILAQQVSVTRSNGITLDANDLTAVFARELEWVDQELQRTKFAPLKSQQLVDFVPAGGPAIERVTYRKVTELGKAKIIGRGTTQLPRVDVVATEYHREPTILGAMYDYTVQDLRNAALATVKLNIERKKGAYNAIMRLHDTVCMIGDTDLGWTGFVNDANVPMVVGATGDWSDSGTTALDIVNDVNLATWSVYTNTLENYMVDTMVVPTSIGSLLDQPLGTDANKTVRSFILANSAHIKRIETSHHLEDAGEDGADRVVFYTKDKEILSYGLNDPFSEEPPQRRGLLIEIPCHGRSSGLQVKQPLAMAYLDL